MEPHLSRGGEVGLFVLDRREETAVAPSATAQAAAAKASTAARRSARHFRPGGRVSVVSRARPGTGATAGKRKEGSQ
jgi:hypothetical protein